MTPSSNEPRDQTFVSSLQPGWLVGNGRYTLTRLLGQGGTATVWLAVDEQLQEEVALKFLPLESAFSPDAFDYFKRETARTRKLTHPNIVRIHDLFKSENEAFISMEFMDAGNLGDLRLLQTNQVFTWSQLYPYVTQLCQALDYAHSEGVIHRDIKPGNLLVNSRGRVKLTDFGFSVLVVETMGTAAERHAGSGTVPYMSPQQLDCENPAVTDDIYSLGATLYELLAGRPPFEGEDVSDQVRESEPPPIPQCLAGKGLESDCPQGICKLIMSCLAKDPAERPSSAKAFFERMQTFAERDSDAASMYLTSPPVSLVPSQAIGGKSASLPVVPPISSWPETEPESEPELVTSVPEESPKQSPWRNFVSTLLLTLTALGAGTWIIWKIGSDPIPELPVAAEGAAIVVDPDENSSFTGSDASESRVNEASIPAPLFAHSDQVTGLAIAGDGALLISASLDDSLRATDLPTGTALWSSAGQQQGIRALAFSSRFSTIATAGSDSTVKLWSSENGELLKTLSSHRAPVSEVVFQPSGNLLASADDLGVIMLWNAGGNNFGTVRNLWRAHQTKINALAFSPDGKWLASGGAERNIRLWSVPDGKPGPVISGHTGNIIGLAFSPDGKWLISTAEDRSLHIWATGDWALERSVRYGSDANRMPPIVFSDDSQWIAAGKAGAVITVYNVNNASRRNGQNLGPRLPNDGAVESLAFLPDNSAVISGSSDGIVRLWPIPQITQ